jgi:P pilus assembly chaperone PapD
MRVKIFLILLLAGCIFPGMSFAITVGPTAIVNGLNPGGSTQGEINVYNEQDEPISVEVEFADWQFMQDGSGKVAFLPRGSTPYSSADWLQATPMKFELAPKENKKVSYNITMPTNAKGGYYAAIFFVAAVKSPPPVAEEGKSAMVLAQRVRLGVLVYNEVLGTQKKVSLLDFNISQPNDKTVKVEYAMKNEGIGYVRSEGKFHIMDDAGKLYGSGVLSTAKMQQADSARAEGEWIGDLPDGEYNLVMTLELKPLGEDMIVKEKRFTVKH